MKKVNFLGFEVNVVDEDDIDEQRESQKHHHYMVLRVVDTDPNAGSPDLRRRRLRPPCEKCREICWIDPKSLDEFRGVNLTIICSHCLHDLIKQNEASE